MADIEGYDVKSSFWLLCWDKAKQASGKKANTQENLFSPTQLQILRMIMSLNGCLVDQALKMALNMEHATMNADGEPAVDLMRDPHLPDDWEAISIHGETKRTIYWNRVDDKWMMAFPAEFIGQKTDKHQKRLVRIREVVSTNGPATGFAHVGTHR